MQAVGSKFQLQVPHIHPKRDYSIHRKEIVTLNSLGESILHPTSMFCLPGQKEPLLSLFGQNLNWATLIYCVIEYGQIVSSG
jgi:hypothetical protein